MAHFALTRGKPLTPDDYRSGFVWLLSVTWGGRVFRFASASVSIDDEDGVTHRFDGGLVVDYAQEAPFLEDAPEDDVSFDGLIFPVDVADWHAKGRHLVGSDAELARWVAGRTLEDREIVAIGVVEATEYGEDGEPIALTMRPEAQVDGVTIPPADARVSAETWATAPDRFVGAYYPTVIGKPGLGISDISRGGSPALLVDDSGNGKWLIAGHPVAATSVVVVAIEDGDSGTLTVTHEEDGLGRLCAVVEGDAGGFKITGHEIHEVWVDWSASAGGAIQYDGSTAAETGQEVVHWLMEASAARHNEGAWRAAKPLIDRYKFAFYVDEPTPPADIMTEAIRPMLPVSLVTGPKGIEPIVWRLDATTQDAVAVLEHDRNVWRAGYAHVERTGLYNEVRIDYAPRSDNGQTHRSRTITGRDVGADLADVWPSAHCRASRSVWGQQSIAVDATHIYDTVTADRVIAWMARAHSSPRTVIPYDDPTGALGYLRPGDVVALTDTPLGFTSRTAYIGAVRWAGTALSLDVILIHDLTRDARS